jgi:hypothetical protein
MSVQTTDLILVCLMPTPRDLEIARLLGWYRIPLRTAPKVVSVDRLAFYQPASFGEAGGRIDLTAAVRGHELTARSELLKEEQDHPRSGDEYYRIQLGPLEPLPRPVRAGRWKRLTFLYTTGEYLLKAETLNDLVVDSAERESLWTSLRERAQGYQSSQPTLPSADVPAEILAALLGISEDSSRYDEADLE